MTQDGKLRDERQTARGWPRIIFLCLAAGAAIFAWRGVISLTADFIAHQNVEATITLASSLTWIAGAVGIIHNGRKMRRVAYVAWIVNLVVPFLALTTDNRYIQRVTPWFEGGSTYFYLPTLGALIGLLWLVWSSPARIATRNGG